MESIETIFEQKWLDVKDEYSDDIKAYHLQILKFGGKCTTKNVVRRSA